MTTSQMAFDHVNNLINDIYTKDLQTFEDRKQIKKMIHERKARKISDMIRKTFDEIKLLDGLIA
jgi:uncharacterized protein YerC